MIRILFTGVGRRIELLQAFRNAALVLNKDLKIYGIDMAGTAPALAYCDYVRRFVAMKDSAYIDNLLEICKENKIDILISTIGTDFKTQIFMVQTMIEESKTLCKAFKPCESMTVQLIRDNDGIYWFIEINPRYGGGVPVSMKAEERSAEAILRILDDENICEFI